MVGATRYLRRAVNLARRARRKGRRLTVRFLVRWRRSLQLRVVATTLLLSAAVVAVLGFFILQQISAGLLRNRELSAQAELSGGLATARSQSGFDTAPSPSDPGAFAEPLTYDLEGRSSVSNPYVVVVRTASALLPSEPANLLTWCGAFRQMSCHIPEQLISEVTREQLSGHDALLQSVPTRLQRANGSVSALAVGAPLGDYQLYYLFPLDQEQQTLQLLQRTLAGVGLVLVLLLAAIASLVTRWVVIPLREAAQAAERLAGGNLAERMPVHGTDDLARLGTSFNQMARSLQDKLVELEELSKVQRQFVSDVSHELRTPLTTIGIAADVLFEAKEQLGEAEARSAELLRSQLERFEALLVDLLEISRYDANVATLETEQVDIRDLVLRSVADSQHIAERRGSGVELRLPGEPCVADVDGRRVERVLRNLIVNAVEHGEGQDILVTVASDRYAVAIAVRDYGVGLRPGEETMVFDRFWRADPARARTSGGTGLGLAIALEDARLHGGWLQAWGEVGKGSVFRLTLPLSVGAELRGSPLPLVPPGSADRVFGREITGLGEADLTPRGASASG